MYRQGAKRLSVTFTDAQAEFIEGAAEHRRTNEIAHSSEAAIIRECVVKMMQIQKTASLTFEEISRVRSK